MFSSFLNKGFQLTFSNGYTVSVQWGASNYCDSRDYTGDLRKSAKQETWNSGTAEVACWPPKGEWNTRDWPECPKDHADDVIGWQDADDVARFIAWVQSLPSVKE